MSDEGHTDRRPSAPEGRRLIEPRDWARQRWGWMESVRRDGSLSSMARLIADVLALEFANSETARCDPSMREIAALLATSQDTVKRGIAALVNAGWLARTPGRGRAISSYYGFVTRAVVVPIKGGKSAPQKGGIDAPFLGADKGADLHPYEGSEKGANLHRKGGKSAPRHYIDKPYKNHRARMAARDGENHPIETGAPRLSENPLVARDAERAVAAWRAGRIDVFAELPRWVMDHIIAADLLTPDERQAAGFAERRIG